jgi:hypothetical protein
MKKLVLLLSVIVLLVIATGAVSAGKPAPDTFTIMGTTAFGGLKLLPNGHTEYYFTAEGVVTGYFEGTFTFNEVVDVAPNSGKIKNNGVIKITTSNSEATGTAIVRFAGKADEESVWGDFKVEKKEGTGDYVDLKGQGSYTGNAAYPGVPFSVTYTGKLKD